MSDGVLHFEKDGKIHLGAYTIDGEIVTLSYLGVYPTKSTQRGNLTPSAIARLLLAEFAQEGAK